MTTQCDVILDNGLRVFTVEQPHLHSVHISFAVRCGSRHEAAQTWGLSHFLEHMVFRGSGRHPSSSHLARVFEQAGGSLQAETWRDHTHFSVTIHPSHVRPVLAALADMLIAPRFDDLLIERGIVEQELLAELDECGGDTDVTNVARACVWHGHPMGRRITGSLGSLRSFTQDDLRQHHARFYVARNSVLSIAGAIDSKRVQALCEDYFGPMNAGTASCDGAAPRFLAACAAHTCYRSFEASQLTLLLSSEALPEGHPDFIAQTLLSSMLDDGMASRLPLILCDQRGLVYDLQSGLDCYADAGVYDVEMTLAPERAGEALDAVLETLGEVAHGGVSAHDLQLAQNRHMHEMAFRQDSTEEVAQHVGISHLFGTSDRLLHEAGQVQQVEVESILRVAKRLFTATPHMTVLGPMDEKLTVERCSRAA